MSKMTPSEYVEAVLKTEAIDFDKIKERLSQPGMIRLLHAGMGLCTEAGEFNDQLKKAVFYGKDVDLINLFEELGDLLWYIGIAMDEIGLPMEECFERNIAKLKKRYAGRFTETKAENRDLAAERKILEGEKALGPMARAARQRPADYELCSPAAQWAIDEQLGILDWDGDPKK